MISVLQRVLEARVVVDGAVIGEIGPGMVALVAVHASDTERDVDWTAGKLTSIRMFRNGEKHFDLDLKQVGGSILLVSNFTVAAATKKGRRPSLEAAAAPERGRTLFEQLVQSVRSLGAPVATGEFGADMQVSLTNDGPVTFLLDSRSDSAVT